MASLNISMPEDMRRFIKKRVKQTSHGTPTEYVRSLIREDQKRAEEDRVKQLLLEGLDSGPPADATSKRWWSAKRTALLKKISQKKRP